MDDRLSTIIAPVVLVVGLVASAAVAATPEVSARDYPSLQAAIDANPGATIHVPGGDYPINATIRIDKDGTSLVGFGRVVMANAEAAILEIEHAENVRIDGLTLTRSPEARETGREGVIVRDARGVDLHRLQVLDNRTRSGAVRFEQVRDARIADCTILNYSSIAVDDRTGNSDLYGYAFRCIDGSGLVVVDSQNVLIEGNTIRESHLRPTAAIKEQHQLGRFVRKNSTRGKLVSEAVWKAEYVNNWHQGSALIVTGPQVSRNIRILGNHIENAAQGIDVHADQVIVSGNIVDDAFIGMKAMHGSRNILISGNQFLRNSLWSIGLMPGAGSSPAVAPLGSAPARPANSDGSSIIANNVISHFGEGSSAWIWKDASRAPLRFDRGQEADDPPLRDVMITGNVIDAGDGETPAYDFAVRIEHGSPTSPVNLRFSGNIFPAGASGVSNVELSP